VKIVEDGNELIITHGNGPQVGSVILQQQNCTHIVPEMPMPVCGAYTQGFLG